MCVFPPSGWPVSSCLDICWVLFHWDINPAGQLLGQLLSLCLSFSISLSSLFQSALALSLSPCIFLPICLAFTHSLLSFLNIAVSQTPFLSLFLLYSSTFFCILSICLSVFSVAFFLSFFLMVYIYHFFSNNTLQFWSNSKNKKRYLRCHRNVRLIVRNWFFLSFFLFYFLSFPDAVGSAAEVTPLT